MAGMVEVGKQKRGRAREHPPPQHTQTKTPQFAVEPLTDITKVEKQPKCDISGGTSGTKLSLKETSRLGFSPV